MVITNTSGCTQGTSGTTDFYYNTVVQSTTCASTMDYYIPEVVILVLPVVPFLVLDVDILDYISYIILYQGHDLNTIRGPPYNAIYKK